jgi:hypothetical protein
MYRKTYQRRHKQPVQGNDARAQGDGALGRTEREGVPED